MKLGLCDLSYINRLSTFDNSFFCTFLQAAKGSFSSSCGVLFYKTAR